MYIVVVTRTEADNVQTDRKMAYSERGTTRYEGHKSEACHQIRSLSLSLLVHKAEC